jgi:hypothetical protein
MEKTMHYDPPREPHPKEPRDPLEIELVYNVRPCGTCRFFWPENPASQPYGPYSSYDFDSNTPSEKSPKANGASFVWIEGTTRPPSFPDPEVMDGCRKAPIMTIGINPNLTAFAPGQTGASWCYPSFSSANGTDSWTKYAYYYRYRSVYQEHFDLKFAEKFLLPGSQVKADKAGVMVSFTRLSDDPAYDIRVQYEGESSASAIHLPGKLGEAPYIVLVDANKPFAKGDVLAAQINIPAGHKVTVCSQQISYYMQMVPVLEQFEAHLKKKGHGDAKLKVGEDVGQLDMVACASPHWGPQWLGGTSQSVNTIISNCVHKNAWAMKQLVQTRPAILFLVGQASWNMFRNSFGHLVHGPQALPAVPEDGPYTLLRLTSQQDYSLQFSTKIGGESYAISTRLVITPHFSYAENFVPQFRMAPEAFASFATKFPTAATFLRHDPRIQFQEPASGYVAAGLVKNAPAVLAEIKHKFASADAELMSAYYDPHRMMSDLLGQLYDKGALTYTKGSHGKPGFLSRSQGPCTFCDNRHWHFPQGCPYGKPEEKQYPIGFLEKVTEALIKRSTTAGTSGV